MIHFITQNQKVTKVGLNDKMQFLHLISASIIIKFCNNCCKFLISSCKVERKVTWEMCDRSKSQVRALQRQARAERVLRGVECSRINTTRTAKIML